jgi:hypothetical protein
MEASESGAPTGSRWSAWRWRPRLRSPWQSIRLARVCRDDRPACAQARVREQAGRGGCSDRRGQASAGRQAGSVLDADGNAGSSGHRLKCALALERTHAREAISAVLDEGIDVIVQEWLPGNREALGFFYARGRIWARFAELAGR